MGSLNQRLTAVRKELGKTVEEIEEQTTAPQKEVNNSEVNDNPSPDIVPNSIYVVGDIYTVTGKDNKSYEIIIEKLSEDGKEVTARLIEK
jgi:predicted ribosome quality control (RQC) complex YloA/Tae2 family protein